MNTTFAEHRPEVRGATGPADRIVIVDDDPVMVDALAGVLDQAGFDEVVGVTDPRDALDLIAEIDTDLVILDLMMQHVDGYQLLAALRAREATRGYLPVMVMTADASPEARALALALEATEVVIKPAGPRYLVRLVHDLLRLRHEANIAPAPAA